MAKAYKCDVCGQFYERDTIPLISVTKSNGTSDRRVDLCDSCQEKLEKWLKEGSEDKSTV